MLQILGKVSVPVPGSPVRVSTSVPLEDPHGLVNDPTAFKCHAVLFQAWHENQGKVYIGRSTMNKANGDNCAAVLAIPSEGSIPVFSVSLTLSPAGVELSDLYMDADQAGEGALVSLLVT